MPSVFRKGAARFVKRSLIAFVVCFSASAAAVAFFFWSPPSGERYPTPQLREGFFPGLVLYPARDDLVANLPEEHSDLTDSLPPLQVDFAFICTESPDERAERISILDGRFVDESAMAPWVSPDDVTAEVPPERAELLLSRINSLTRDRLQEYGLSSAGRGEMRVERTLLPDGAIQYRTRALHWSGHVEYRAQYEVREAKAYLSSWSYHTHRAIGNAQKLWAAGILSAILALLFAIGSLGSEHRAFRLTRTSIDDQGR